MDLGDRAEDSTIDFTFSTRNVSAAPATLAGTPVISVYKANGTTQSVAGVTLTVDFDSLTGFNHVRIDTSADAFYATSNDYSIIITTGTVNSVSVVGNTVATFSIENRFMRGTNSANTVVPPSVSQFNARTIVAANYLQPTVPGRTLDVTATGATGIDWNNVENQSSTVNLSSTNIDTDQVVASVSGNVDGSVGSVTGAVGSVAGNVDGSVASVTGAVGSVTGNVGGSVASVTAINATGGAIDNVTLVDTTTTNTDMRGNDSANTVVPMTAALSQTEHDATQSAIAALNDFDPSADTVANVTLVDTTTTNTDMVGTDDAATATALATVDANVDAILVDTGTTLPAQITALNNITAADVLAAGDIDGFTLEEAQKLNLAALVGILAGAATNTITIQAADGSKVRLTATVDSDGNRSAVTKDATG